MRVVIVAAGALADGDERHLSGADLVIAADGGAATLDRLGRHPDRLVGDLDSVEPELVGRLERQGVSVERHPLDKEASDTELALAAARLAGATEVVLLGTTGGPRLDHELASLLLLADPSLASLGPRVVHGPTTLRVLHGGGSLRLEGRVGDLVSLLPIGGDAAGVTVGGVRWPLERATLRMGRSRGLSNEVVAASASVSLERGALLVIETATKGAPIP